MFKVDAGKIRTLVTERGLSLVEFATQAGLNGLTARKVLTDGSAVNLKIIGTLAKFFGVGGNELILKAD